MGAKKGQNRISFDFSSWEDSWGNSNLFTIFNFKNPISDTKVGKIWEWGGNKIIASFDRNEINFVKGYTPLSSRVIDLPPIYCTKSAHYFGC